MKHLKEALDAIVADGVNADYIKVAGNNVVFTIQDGPIGETGVNGVQAVDMLVYVTALFNSLDKAYPCKENKDTLVNLLEAIRHQDERTQNREARGVEGLSKA
jgi:hypothetical protein